MLPASETLPLTPALRSQETITMSFEDPPLIALPTELSDEAVAQLIAWLYELAGALENHYTAQLLRYYHRHDDGLQQPLWPDDEPPF